MLRKIKRKLFIYLFISFKPVDHAHTEFKYFYFFPSKIEGHSLVFSVSNNIQDNSYFYLYFYWNSMMMYRIIICSYESLLSSTRFKSRMQGRKIRGSFFDEMIWSSFSREMDKLKAVLVNALMKKVNFFACLKDVEFVKSHFYWEQLY